LLAPSQTGVALAHAEAPPVRQGTQAPVVGLQAGVAPPHCVSAMHFSHVSVVGLHTGVAPSQSVATPGRQATHVLLAVSQWILPIGLPAHCAESVHSTQMPGTSLQVPFMAAAQAASPP